MVRLTKAMREQISNSIANKKYPKSIEEKLDQGQKEYCDKLYDTHILPLVPIIKALPQRFTEESNRRQVLYRRGSSTGCLTLVFTEPKTLLADDGWNNVNFPELTPKESDKWHSFVQKRIESDESRNKTETEVYQALQAFTTVEKLQELWPEAYVFLEYKPVDKNSGLPMVQIAGLNERLGL